MTNGDIRRGFRERIGYREALAVTSDNLSNIWQAVRGRI